MDAEEQNVWIKKNIIYRGSEQSISGEKIVGIAAFIDKFLVKVYKSSSLIHIATQCQTM